MGESMTQVFKTKGEIKATLTKINSRGGIRFDWEIQDEKNACNSCLICNHYKYNHNNIKDLGGKFVHICLLKSPDFIDVSKILNKNLNTSCINGFLRRAIG